MSNQRKQSRQMRGPQAHQQFGNRAMRMQQKAQQKKMLKELQKKPLNIHCVFIALNEEESIPRLAKSLKGFSTRNVLVDTGSTDRTVELAKEHGFEVYEMKWPNHFAEARNKAVEIAKCDDADWICMFDADEVLKDGWKLKNEMKIIRPEIDVIAIWHKTGAGHNFHRNCIWRPGKAEWKYRVHEHLIPHQGKAAVLSHTVEHPDAIGTTHDNKKVLEMLADDAEEFSDNATRQYYYGRQLYYEDRMDAIPFLERVDELSTWEDEASAALVFAGLSFEKKAQWLRDNNQDFQEDLNKALEFYRRAVVRSGYLRAAYAGVIRLCPDPEERMQAAYTCLNIIRPRYFDDPPQWYREEFNEHLKGVIKECAEQLGVTENVG